MYQGSFANSLLAPATTPLLEYASSYWGRHTRKGMTENIKILALRLLDRFDEHISAQLQLLQYNRDDSGDSLRLNWTGGPKGFRGLHGVAFLGIAGIVLLDLDGDIRRNETAKRNEERQGITPNTIAHRSGGKTLLFTTTTTPRSTTHTHPCFRIRPIISVCHPRDSLQSL